MNRLVGRLHDENPLATDGYELRSAFIYDGTHVAMRFDEDNPVLSLDGLDQTHRYLWGPATDMLLADESFEYDGTSASFEGPVLWALTDHLGTVRDLVDESGALQNHKSYDAFGNVTAETNASIDTVFGYTGKFYDDEAGLQNSWHRWYDATVGRWISEDFVWDGVNRSAYVGNSPTNLVDPTGLFSEGLFWHNVGLIDSSFGQWFSGQGGSVHFGDYWWSSLRWGDDGPVAHIDTDLNEWDAALKFVDLQNQFIGPGNTYKASLICSSDNPADAYRVYINDWYKKSVQAASTGANAYLSLLGIANEGYDIVVTASDVGKELGKGQFYTAGFHAIGFLPGISNGVITIAFSKLDSIKIPEAARWFSKNRTFGLGFIDPCIRKRTGRPTGVPVFASERWQNVQFLPHPSIVPTRIY